MHPNPNGGHAFPTLQTTESTDGIKYVHSEAGMKLRDWFAGQALMGLAEGVLTAIAAIGGPADKQSVSRIPAMPALMASNAYSLADAMIFERGRAERAECEARAARQAADDKAANARLLIAAAPPELIAAAARELIAAAESAADVLDELVALGADNGEPRIDRPLAELRAAIARAKGASAADAVTDRAYTDDEYFAKLDDVQQRLKAMLQEVRTMRSHCEAGREDSLAEAASQLGMAVDCLDEARV